VSPPGQQNTHQRKEDPTLEANQPIQDKHQINQGYQGEAIAQQRQQRRFGRVEHMSVSGEQQQEHNTDIGGEQHGMQQPV